MQLRTVLQTDVFTKHITVVLTQGNLRDLLPIQRPQIPQFLYGVKKPAQQFNNY